MKLILAFLFTLSFTFSKAQEFTIDEMYSVLNYADNKLDEILTGKGYTLNDKDSSAGYEQFYYVASKKQSDTLLAIRSFTITRSSYKTYDGKLFLYRTYDENEQKKFLDFFTNDNYKLIDSYTSGNTEVSIYKKGSLSIVNRIATNHTPEKDILSYEIELGG